MIAFEIKAGQELLTRYIASALDTAFDNEGFDTHGLKIQLNRVGDAWTHIEARSLMLHLPMGIKVEKAAGLFSAEATGKINLKVQVQINIEENLDLLFRTDLISFDWLEEPVLDIGAFDIPVEKIVSLMINHYESIITAKVDERLNKSIDLPQILSDRLAELQELLNSNALFNIKAYLSVKEILMTDPLTLNGEVIWKGLINAEVKVAEEGIEEQKQKPAFRWIRAVDGTNMTLVPVEILYSKMTPIAVSFLEKQSYGGKPLKFTEPVIQKTGKGMQLSVSLISPVEGDALVSGQPVYNESTRKLNIEDLKFKFKAQNVLVRMTTPLFNRYFENVIKEYLPIDTQKIIRNFVLPKAQEQLKLKFGTVDYSLKDVQISELKFEDSQLVARAKLIDGYVAIKLEGFPA